MTAPPIAIGPDTLVTVAYRAYNDDGELVDSSPDDLPLSYVHGRGQITIGLEQALDGMFKGQSRSFVVPPELAYGEYDPEGVLEVERSDFPESEALAMGDQYMAESPDGDTLALTVLDVRADAVVVDTNHPLAGETLRFEVEVIDVRSATAEELAEAGERPVDAAEHEQDGRLVALRRKPGCTTLLS